MTFSSGNQIGKFVVDRVLGRGGFGGVYLCRDTGLDELVAIKVFDVRDDSVAGLVTSEGQDPVGVLRGRFIDEARILRRIGGQSHIVSVFEFDHVEPDTPYYVMPYYPRALKDELDAAGGPLTISRAMAVLSQLAEALAQAHAHNLVHRDIKPSNLLLDEQGDVWLCDFGIAKLPEGDHTMTGVGMGSRDYMSPEQRESAKHVDTRSDIYAFGVLAYRMVTGRMPIGSFAPALSLNASVGAELSDLIQQCLAPDPNERPKDGRFLLRALQHAAAGVNKSAPEEGVTAFTGTFVSGEQAGLRDEVKPLASRIESMLLEHGEIPADERPRLRAIADVAGLTDSEFDLLVEEIRASHLDKIVPIENLTKAIDRRLDETGGRLSKEDQEDLYAAGKVVGWSAVRVQKLLHHRIELRGGKVKSGGSAKWAIAAVLMLAIGGGGYWAYGVWMDQRPASTASQTASLPARTEEQPSFERQQEEQARAEEVRRQDEAAARRAAELEAQRLADLQAQQEEDARREAELAAQLAAQEAADEADREAAREAEREAAARAAIQRSQTMQVQQALIRLGYDVTADGHTGAETQAAIIDFQTIHGFPKDGTITSSLLDTLNKEADQRNDPVWQVNHGVEFERQGNYAEALIWYRKAADQDHPVGQSNIANMYREGRGVEKNNSEAAKWYLRSAEQGHVTAQYNLGVLYVTGEGVRQDYREAVYWYRKAADQGHAEAQNALGFRYENGQGVAKDESEAVRWYRLAADQGNMYAQYNLGNNYRLGRGVKRNNKEAFRWLSKSAEQGYANAQSLVGMMYRDGTGVTQNYGAAVNWYRKAAEQGIAEAQNSLGVRYKDGQGVAQNYAEALKWFRRAADQGDADSQNNLGIMYEYGRGVAANDAEAVRWYQLAANQNHARAQSNLATMYRDGTGVAKNNSEANRLFLKSANQGHAFAQHQIGQRYKSGNGINQSDVEAVKWFRKAANQGYAGGQSSLGLMYETGRGVQQDYGEAVRWYRKAANQGHAMGQAFLGEMYANGKGVTQDYSQASYWYKRAIAGGSEFATKYIKKLPARYW